MTSNKLTIVRGLDRLYARYPMGQMVRITPKGLSSDELDEEIKRLTMEKDAKDGQ